MAGNRRNIRQQEGPVIASDENNQNSIEEDEENEEDEEDEEYDYNYSDYEE